MIQTLTIDFKAKSGIQNIILHWHECFLKNIQYFQMFPNTECSYLLKIVLETSESETSSYIKHAIIFLDKANILMTISNKLLSNQLR